MNLKTNEIYLADNLVTQQECVAIVNALGWLEYELPQQRIIEKTDKFINSFGKHLKNHELLEATEIAFQNSRRINTEKYVDRIKIVCPGVYDFTLMYGMPGLGASYGLFSAENGFKHPVFSGRTVKQVADYINNYK